jgi:hypothetical protein
VVFVADFVVTGLINAFVAVCVIASHNAAVMMHLVPPEVEREASQS